jgi:hypothetical protein
MVAVAKPVHNPVAAPGTAGLAHAATAGHKEASPSSAGDSVDVGASFPASWARWCPVRLVAPCNDCVGAFVACASIMVASRHAGWKAPNPCPMLRTSTSRNRQTRGAKQQEQRTTTIYVGGGPAASGRRLLLVRVLRTREQGEWRCGD